ncbi:20771_t:CDS:2 [Gigaspora margarita]|uniref:20771_t:CDS:1 n=1 Tax=Gigaspora margarita TaxID=4874 RepID=A0ABM8W756_GIGMA|nr:20771_t:CDS:2 [Gigaspora margarita]
MDTRRNQKYESHKRTKNVNAESTKLLTTTTAATPSNDESTELLTTTTMATPSNDETKKHQNAATFLKKSGSLITSLLAKQSYNEESAPKMSMQKSTELLTTTQWRHQATTR